jgi:hypothetical protein
MMPKAMENAWNGKGPASVKLIRPPNGYSAGGLASAKWRKMMAQKEKKSIIKCQEILPTKNIVSIFQWFNNNLTKNWKKTCVSPNLLLRISSILGFYFKFDGKHAIFLPVVALAHSS